MTSEVMHESKGKDCVFSSCRAADNGGSHVGDQTGRRGLSRERLQRIHETIQRHIDSHDISGAVTLVARKGRIAHLEAHGFMDLESKKPMAKNSIFRIWSMSKPVAGAAILMLMEEGKVRLNDPVSRFIPEFKGMKVAVTQERSLASTGSGSSQSGSANGQLAANPSPVLYDSGSSRNYDPRSLDACVRLGQRSCEWLRDTENGKKPGDTLADYIPRLGLYATRLSTRVAMDL